MIDITAGALADGNAVGWMQGHMEFGPRALEIDPSSQITVFGYATGPESLVSFRILPSFAPSILAEHLNKWFEFEGPSPYMLFVADILKQHRRDMTPERSPCSESKAKCAALFCARHYTCGLLSSTSNRSRRNKPVISCATESIHKLQRSNACKY